LERAVGNLPQFLKSDKDISLDSCKRLALVGAYTLAATAQNRYRMKKCFNPILGETYEFVADKYRILSEQVSHHPPIFAYKVEGDGYSVIGK
jgi:hypothetical protein